jgi:hypothetical protein
VTDHAVNPAVDDHLDIRDVERRVKAIFIGSVGNLVEWYDFYAYTAFALYFAPAFFPQSDPVVQQLNAAVLFAATFLMRPLGGWLFGYIADRYGRRLSLTLSVVCMCFGSLIIAITPTYASIGVAAPAILALARVIEGLSLGGEWCQRDLPERSRRRQASRFLLELSIRHLDRRPTHRHHRTVAAAKGVSDAAGIEGLGLADTVRDRRHPCHFRRGDAT